MEGQHVTSAALVIINTQPANVSEFFFVLLLTGCADCNATTTCNGHGSCNVNGSTSILARLHAVFAGTCACFPQYTLASRSSCATNHFNYPSCLSAVHRFSSHVHLFLQPVRKCTAQTAVVFSARDVKADIFSTLQAAASARILLAAQQVWPERSSLSISLRSRSSRCAVFCQFQCSLCQ